MQMQTDWFLGVEWGAITDNSGYRTYHFNSKITMQDETDYFCLHSPYAESCKFIRATNKKSLNVWENIEPSDDAFIHINNQLFYANNNEKTIYEIWCSTENLQKIYSYFSIYNAGSNDILSIELTLFDIYFLKKFINYSRVNNDKLKPSVLYEIPRIATIFSTLNIGHKIYITPDAWITKSYPSSISLSDKEISEEVIYQYKFNNHLILNPFKNFHIVGNQILCSAINSAFPRGRVIDNVSYMDDIFMYYENMRKAGYMETVKVLRAIIYLEKFLKQSIKDEFLTNDSIWIITCLLQNKIEPSTQLLAIFNDLIALNILLDVDMIRHYAPLIKQNFYTNTLMLITSDFQEKLNEALPYFDKKYPNNDFINQTNNQGNNSLIIAVNNNNITVVKKLLATKKVILDLQNNKKETALTTAIKLNLLEISNILLAQENIKIDSDVFYLIYQYQKNSTFLMLLKNTLSLAAVQQDYLFTKFPYKNSLECLADLYPDEFWCYYYTNIENENVQYISQVLDYFEKLLFCTFMAYIKDYANKCQDNIQKNKLLNFYNELYIAKISFLQGNNYVSCQQNFQSQCKTSFIAADKNIINKYHPLQSIGITFFANQQEQTFLNYYNQIKENFIQNNKNK